MANAGMALAIIGGLLILLDGVLVMGGMTLSPLGYVVGVADLFTSGGLATVAGVLVLVGGIRMGKAGSERYGAVIALVFSVLAVVAGGGFIIGSLLGIVGGILGFVRK